MIFNDKWDGCIALVTGESGSGSPLEWDEWNLKDGQVLVVFDDGGRLMLDDIQEEDLLVFRARGG